MNLFLTQFGHLILEKSNSNINPHFCSIIKTEDQIWDASVIFSLLNYLDFQNQFGTFDADAIEVCLDLASISQSRGSKTIFVLTDGYGTRGTNVCELTHESSNGKCSGNLSKTSKSTTNLQSLIVKLHFV